MSNEIGVVHDQDEEDEEDPHDKIKNVESILINSSEQNFNQSVTHRHQCHDQAYKKKSGDLVFNAHYEGGNLGSVKKVDQFEYDLYIRPDVTNPRYHLWFNFTVSNQKLNQCVIFTFVNMSAASGANNLLKLFDLGLTPCVRAQSTSSPTHRLQSDSDWRRLNENQTFCYHSPHHNDNLVLSIAFKFPLYDCHYQFALFYPYTFSDLDHFLVRWAVELKRRRLRLKSRSKLNKIEALESVGQRFSSKNQSMESPGLQIDKLAKSSLNLPIYRITISNQGTVQDSAGDVLCSETICNSNKPLAIIFGRSSGNLGSISSLVCQGLMDFALSDHPVAVTARQQIDLLVIPMIDPDSIFVGNCSSDLWGQTNLDDELLDANGHLYEGVSKMDELIERILAESDKNRRIILLEFGVRNDLIGARIVGNRFKDLHRMTEHAQLPRILSRFAEGFYIEQCEFHEQLKLSSFCRSKLLEHHRQKHFDCYRLEVSPLAYYQRSLVDIQLKNYGQKQYLLLGKAVVYALAELTRSRRLSLQPEAANLLDSFRPRQQDLDDVSLKPFVIRTQLAQSFYCTTEQKQSAKS